MTGIHNFIYNSLFSYIVLSISKLITFRLTLIESTRIKRANYNEKSNFIS